MKTTNSNEMITAAIAAVNARKNASKAADTQSWSKAVWEKSAEIYEAILNLDFLKELADGTLASETFSRYIAQDELYLKNYYHQMLMLSDLMKDEQDKKMFIDYAQDAMQGEKDLHDMLIAKYGIDTAVEPSKVTSDYNAHICDGISSGDPCVALAAVLPCMWIYNCVGLHILDNAKLEGNPFKEWIMEYGNEEFTVGVNRVLRMIDEWASEADAETRAKMDYYYLKSALYEYAFWDYGYYADTKSYEYTDMLLRDNEDVLNQ